MITWAQACVYKVKFEGNMYWQSLQLQQGSLWHPGSRKIRGIYSSSLGHLLRDQMVGFHFYDGDSQIYITASPDQVDAASTQMEECVRLVSTWMSQHHLMMNYNKSEFLVLSSKHTAREIRPPKPRCVWPLSDTIQQHRCHHWVEFDPGYSCDYTLQIRLFPATSHRQN